MQFRNYIYPTLLLLSHGAAAQGTYPSPTLRNLTITGALSSTGTALFSTTTDTSYSAYGTVGATVATHLGQSSIVGFVLNDAAPNSVLLPGGVSGFAKVTTTGNQAFGVYGLGALNTTSGTAIGGEFTSRNFCGAPDTNLPPNSSIGTPTCVANGVQITSGGTFANSVGLIMGAEAGSTVGFNTDIYLKPDYGQFGIFVEAPTTGNRTSMVLKNNGIGINLQLNTTGALAGNNTVLTALDASSVSRFSVRQIGDVYGRSWNSNSVAVGTIGPCSGAGAGATCTFAAGSNDGAGTITITARTSAASSGSIGVNFANSIGSNSSACIYQVVNGTGSWAAGANITITSQGLNASGIVWINGGATVLTNALTYQINYWCPGR